MSARRFDALTRAYRIALGTTNRCPSEATSYSGPMIEVRNFFAKSG